MSRIHLSKAEVGDVEIEFVLDALHSGWIAPLGPHVDAFEVEIAERVGVASALALSSGTAALHLALLEVGAAPGRVVVVPSLTFVASANAVVYTGAEPVFVDSSIDDGNICPDLLLEVVDRLRHEGADIAAVMTVDLLGRCVDYEAIVGPLEERGIPLVEDAAEALGAATSGGAAGSFGVAAALSFNGNKILTTSGGGMLLSDNPDFIGRCRYLSTQAREPKLYYEHTEIGYNYRLSNILAALGRGQLRRLDEMMSRRRQIRQMYLESLGGIDGIRFLGHGNGRKDDEDNCWLTTIVLNSDACASSATDVIDALDSHDIEARRIWKPMHRQPVFAHCRSFINGASDALFNGGINLPSGAQLSNDDVMRTGELVAALVGGH
ncbi:MAG: aminotransferase class I/II-fold pyridoxal phosphate-dependent enzyme [Nakamurella sp.]